MATNQYLTISDGTTSVTIADGAGGATNYRLLRGTWAPQVAGLRRSQLGGAGQYDDVIEEMQLIVSGTTSEAALTNVQTLNVLMEQAELWYRGDPVSPVLLSYSPRGASTSGTASPLQAVILGRADGDSSAVTLPDVFEDVGQFKYVANVTVRFKRRGLWLHATDAASSSATTNGDLATIILAAAANAQCPTELSLSNIFSDTGATIMPPTICITDFASDIWIRDAEALATGSFAGTADSANYARGGSVLRYTPPDTDGRQTLGGTISITASARNIAVLINYRNNSTTTNFTVTPVMTCGTAPGYSVSGNPFYIEAAATAYPQWRVIDVMGLVSTPYTVSLLVQADAATGSLDIDTIVLVNVSNPASAIVQIGSYPTIDAGTLTLYHNALSGRNPTVAVAGIPMPYYSNPYLTSRAGRLYGVVLQTGSRTDNLNNWRAHDVGSDLYSNTWTATRTNGYLVPR